MPNGAYSVNDDEIFAVVKDDPKNNGVRETARRNLTELERVREIGRNERKSAQNYNARFTSMK